MTLEQIFQDLEDRQISMNFWHFARVSNPWHCELTKEIDGASVRVEEVASGFESALQMAHFKLNILIGDGLNKLTAIAPPEAPPVNPDEVPF